MGDQDSGAMTDNTNALIKAHLKSTDPTQSGKFYKFTKSGKSVYVPESDIGKVEGFEHCKPKQTVRSMDYNLIGSYDVEIVEGKFYKVTQVSYIPVSSSPEQQSTMQTGGRRRKVTRRKVTRRKVTRRKVTRLSR
jgi:hypothetical protein